MTSVAARLVAQPLRAAFDLTASICSQTHILSCAGSLRTPQNIRSLSHALNRRCALLTLSRMGSNARLGSSSSSKPPQTTQKGPAAESEPIKNRAIDANSVLVISEAGAVLGVKTLAEAMRLVDLDKYDLVLVSNTQTPPVCRIRPKTTLAEQRKKQQQAVATKKPRQSTTKEIEVNSTISNHDLEVKLDKAQEILARGHRLQLTVFERGDKQSPIVFKTFVERLRDHSKMSGAPTSVNRKITVLLSPKE